MDERKKKKIISVMTSRMRENYSIIYNFLKTKGKEIARLAKISSLEEFNSLIEELPEPRFANIYYMNYLFYSIVQGNLKWVGTLVDDTGSRILERASSGFSEQRITLEDLKISALRSNLYKYASLEMGDSEIEAIIKCAKVGAHPGPGGEGPPEGPGGTPTPGVSGGKRGKGKTKVIINPETGKPLTEEEKKILIEKTKREVNGLINADNRSHLDYHQGKGPGGRL